MVRNTRTGTTPIVLHATGRNGRLNSWALLKQEVLAVLEADPPVSVDPGASWALFTWSTLDWETCLEACCRVIGCDLTVMRVPDPGLWQNVMKIDLTVSFLRRCRADYVVGLDALDVLMLGHPSEIVCRYREQFEPLGCQLMFNASVMPWPKRGTICDECLDFEMTFEATPDRHLNAGAWVGRRDYALAFWEGVMALRSSPDWPHEYRHSEQIVVRTHAFPTHYPDVDIDRHCVIFQHMEAGKTDLLTLDARLTSGMVRQ